jgi:hypothetical protein
MKHIRKFESFLAPASTPQKTTTKRGADMMVQRLQEIYKTLSNEGKREINQYFEKK